MPSFLATRLAVLARKKIAESRPLVVVVTGSVGKTSARNAIAIALGADGRDVRVPYKNYNNELGVPLAILGEKSPGKNLWEWMKLFARARRGKIPDTLVLEYGADHPGDLAYLATIARPSIVVVTTVSPVHVANYPNFDALAREKASLLPLLPPDGLAVLNAHDDRVAAMRGAAAAPVSTYGPTGSDAWVESALLETKKNSAWTSGETYCLLTAEISVGEEHVPLVLRNCASDGVLQACAAALLVARHAGIALPRAAAALSRQVEPIAGRLRPIAGIKGSLILDDTYNAAPASVAQGLTTLGKFLPHDAWDRRIAVLGDMAELGDLAEQEHRIVGRRVAQVADLFIAVGPQMRWAMEDAIQRGGMAAEKIHWCADSVEAGRLLDREIRPGDVTLVKGSQSMRMERAVRDIMADPAHASDLLVRQEAAWRT